MTNREQNVIIGIDTSNLLISTTSPYTATQDCWCITQNSPEVKINNVPVVHHYSDSTVDLSSVILKKGQTLTFSGTVNVYGLEY